MYRSSCIFSLWLRWALPSYACGLRKGHSRLLSRQQFVAGWSAALAGSEALLAVLLSLWPNACGWRCAFLSLWRTSPFCLHLFELVLTAGPGFCALVKKKLKSMSGTFYKHLPSYLDEFVWFRNFTGDRTFSQLLEDNSEQFPLQ